MTKVEQLLQLMSDRLGAGANVMKVYGRPIEAGGRVVVPVAKVAYGFGAGSGRNRGYNSRSEKSSGGGGGAVAIPVGILEITARKSRYIPLNYTRSLLLAGALGALIGACIAAPRKPFSGWKNRWVPSGRQQNGVVTHADPLRKTPATNNLQYRSLDD